MRNRGRVDGSCGCSRPATLPCRRKRGRDDGIHLIPQVVRRQILVRLSVDSNLGKVVWSLAGL